MSPVVSQYAVCSQSVACIHALFMLCSCLMHALWMLCFPHSGAQLAVGNWQLAIGKREVNGPYSVTAANFAAHVAGGMHPTGGS
jgi:hypothetical protein